MGGHEVPETPSLSPLRGKSEPLGGGGWRETLPKVQKDGQTVLQVSGGLLMSVFDRAWELVKIDMSDITDFIHHSLENGPSKRSILTDGGDWPSDPSEHESHCFDFSDNLHHLIEENGGEAQIMNHPDDPAIHQWVYHPASGLHFDAQTPYGVEDWKGLGGLYD